MPSIEIISVDCRDPITFSGSSHFGVLIEKGAESHHGLFNKELESVSGFIAHIGNKDHEECNFEICFASDLIEWDDTEIILPEIDLDNVNGQNDWGQNQACYYELRNKVRTDLRDLFQIMLSASPCHEILFFSRYQFGPEVGEEFEAMEFDEFWNQHALKYLRWNTLYRIKTANKALGVNSETLRSSESTS